MRTLWLVMACASLAWAANATKPSDSKPAQARNQAIERWPAQELKSTVSMVDPQQDLLVVRDSSGVPFDFEVRHSTHILNGEKPVKLSNLAKNQTVDVKFVPEARGDIARAIQIQR